MTTEQQSIAGEVP